jgi:hypothetical protein
LQRRLASGFEDIGDFAEIDRPIFLAHGLEHFDGGDLVEGAVDIAVILAADVDESGEVGALDTFLRVDELGVGDGEAGDACADFPSGVFGETAPAATDFENMFTGLQIEG